LIALRTQQIIATESGVTNTIDPLAGSYAIEKLTSQVEEAAKEYLRKIDAMGGTLRAIENGYIQREIQQAAYDYQKSIESGKRVVVGVNRYQDERGTPLPLLRIDPETERTQVERLGKLRARRDASRLQAALRQVEETAHSEQNLMPAILEAVKAYATVGEISDALRRVFGEFQESVVI
jgi:methylmalonyl-CoA mutase N-terminal domain/subunit